MQDEQCAQIRKFAQQRVVRQGSTHPNSQITRLPDGTQVACNVSGHIDFALFNNGMAMNKFESYVIVANTSNGHWFRDKKCNWHSWD